MHGLAFCESKTLIVNTEQGLAAKVDNMMIRPLGLNHNVTTKLPNPAAVWPFGSVLAVCHLTLSLRGFFVSLRVVA